jgi:hypothetical protein
VKSRAATFGRPVTLAATVKFIGTSPAAPVGFVTFADGGTILATVPLHVGKASFTTSTLPIGRNAIHAAYGGAPGAMGSKSPLVPETIRPLKSKSKMVRRSVNTAFRFSVEGFY